MKRIHFAVTGAANDLLTMAVALVFPTKALEIKKTAMLILFYKNNESQICPKIKNKQRTIEARFSKLVLHKQNFILSSCYVPLNTMFLISSSW